MSRVILHLDLDTFFVSCERLQKPELIGKPVIVGGNGDERGVVAACSYEARAFGVYSSMPLKWAKKACPQAIFIRGTHSLYSGYSQKVTQIVAGFAPRFEKASVDEFYIDITGMYKYIFNTPVEAAAWLQKEIGQRTGLPASCGIGSNRLMAKVGSKLAKPAGIFYTAPGTEAEILAPLPVSILPGVGDSTEEILKKWAVKTVGDLQSLPSEKLEKQFGKWGSDLFLKARGKGRDEISEESERKSVSSERTFHEDSSDPGFIRNQIIKCAEEVGFQLRKNGLKGKTMTLKIRTSGFSTHTHSETYPIPVNDDPHLIRYALDLFDLAWKPGVKTRLIGFGVHQLDPAEEVPLDLFQGEETSKMDSLYRQVDLVKTKYGKKTLRIAGTDGTVALKSPPGNSQPVTHRNQDRIEF